MIVADLFVNLGIKGAEKTVGALTGVEKSLKGLGSMSLEAKAAIVGAMYALERLFSKSGQAGTDLTNFNALLGGSTKTLQQYQYAARQVGISNEETEGTFKALQSSMTKLRMGEGAPKGYAQVAMLTGGITSQDVERFMQNPELLLQRLQQYAQKEKRLGLRNEALKSFGLSDNMVAALSRGAFTPQVLSKAPTYSDKEISALDKANIAWSNLGNRIQMAIGHFNARHGTELVKDFTVLTDKVLALANAFMKLSEAVHLFEFLNKSVQGLTMLMGVLTDSVNKLGSPKGRDELKTDTEDLFKGMWESLKEGAENMFFGNSEEQEKKPAAKPGAPTEQKPGTPHKAPPQTGETKRHELRTVVHKVFQKEAGVFRPITEDLFGKNPPAKIPETAVTKTTQPETKVVHGGKETTVINNNVTKESVPVHPKIAPGKETVIKGGEKETHTVIKPGKEHAKNDRPQLRLVVPPTAVSATTGSPKVPRDNGGKVTTQNFNVNQSFSYSHDGKDQKQTADTMKKAVQEAFRQMSSQVQGS
jgi:hypothetical protein